MQLNVCLHFDILVAYQAGSVDVMCVVGLVLFYERTEACVLPSGVGF
jgi:hypothetical protein